MRVVKVVFVVGFLLAFPLVTDLFAARPIKDIGINYPDAIIRGGPYSPSLIVGAPFQMMKGDIDGNGIPDLIFTGGMAGTTRRYVGVFFDAALSSLNGRDFSHPDFLIISQKKFPWASDVVKFHPMHWLAVADLNQDGFDDIVFSLPIIDLGGGLRDEKGEVYVVLGNTRANLGTTWDFAVKPPSFTFFGKDAGDRAGFSLATGDINGDGRKDLLIGAPSADGPNNAFIDGGEIYGITHFDWTKSSMVLTKSNVDLYIYGEAGQKYGYAVTVGNLNGDIDAETSYPIDDIIIAPYLSPGGPVRVIFGKNSERKLSTSSDWTSSYNLIPRHPNLTTGDLNRDGIDDLVAADAGVYTYIQYGSQTAISTLADVKVWNSFNIGNYTGFSNFVSDFDGDGIEDLALLAARSLGQYNQYTIPVGEAHIVWGQMTRLPSVIDLKTESTHFSLYGSDGTGPTGLSSNFQGAWNSTYGSVLGTDLDGNGTSELLFVPSGTQNTYIYKTTK